MKIQFLKKHNIDGKGYQPKDELEVSDQHGASLIRRKIGTEVKAQHAPPTNPAPLTVKPFVDSADKAKGDQKSK